MEGRESGNPKDAPLLLLLEYGIAFWYSLGMAALLIKQLPDALHRRLKAEAVRHRRSMAKEVLVLLERGLAGAIPPPPPPFKGRFPITGAWLSRAIRQGRA